MRTLIVLVMLLSLTVPAFASEWEEVSKYISRTRLPHGWLVKMREADYGPSFAAGICYVPDENHEWRL